MKFSLHIILIGFVLLTGCKESESEYEVETRNELSSIIRVIDNTHKNIYESRSQVGSQSRLSSNDFYNQQSKRFQNLSEDLAGAPNAEKFDTVRQYLEDIISLSNEYVYTKKGLFKHTLDISNKYKSYQDNLGDLADNTMDLNDDLTNTYIRNRLSQDFLAMREDSADFYANKVSVKDELEQYENTESQLMSTTKELNDVLIGFSFRDTLSFHTNYVFKDSVVMDMWSTLSVAELHPSDDMKSVFEAILNN